MNINHSEYTIAEIAELFKKKDLIINRHYQRASGVWPISAKVFFIDTLLENYPFPKMYFYQLFDRAKRRPVMEVIDGQQRLMTILEFVDGDFKLNKGSKNYAGMAFSNLSEEQQEKFLMYRVPVDVILAAQRSELLEMFRRMNAYTAPLNTAEKRHSQFQGAFKWFAVELSSKISPMLEEWGILTTKQIVRMSDSELIAELSLVLEKGLINKSETEINKIYSKYDDAFPVAAIYESIISGFFESMATNFSELRGTNLSKPYAIHSLFAAYAHITHGIPNGEVDLGFPTRNKAIKVSNDVKMALLEISDAQELKEVTGKYGQYVAAALSTTTKVAQRRARTKVLAQILDPK
ncbi:DUF262 domain-containing protein [Alishewanella sp. HH-ZS]|uniref:DUF262 domain-containing protein n=1 Tax=Alishewanella sp. HH-ZS TaxID=1856684 RepID=UPI000823709F|nr:DUF262 domain-containing protein [Alishewanella sp. HH-ZS]OCW96945.1 hypothetical protein A9165_08700 [Alishewanella sp. HH-ZS]